MVIKLKIYYRNFSKKNFFPLYNLSLRLYEYLKAGMSNSKHCAGRKRSFEAKKRCLRAAVKNIIDLVFVLEAFLVKFICEMFKSIQI